MERIVNKGRQVQSKKKVSNISGRSLHEFKTEHPLKIAEASDYQHQTSLKHILL